MSPAERAAAHQTAVDTDQETAATHAEATAAETIGDWPKCECPHHGGGAR